MMKFAGRFGAALACSTALIPVTAYAQDAAAEEEAITDPNIIIVTATRRAEDVQDIPIAVTAISPVQLEKQGVVNVQNITSVSPSFSTSNAQTSSGTVVLRIRGIGTTSNNIGFESAVGIFVDGAYQSRPGVALGEFVDVERVEVLRGPQGTLFGRNTSAGALNITNVRPDLDEFGGFVNASIGSYDLRSVQGAINAPIVPGSVALRVTGAYRERDGYVTVQDGAGNEIGESNGVDQYLVRAQLGFETDSGIRGRLIGDYSNSSAGCCTAVELLQSGVETAGLFGAVGLGARGGMSAPAVATDPNDVTTMQEALDNRISSGSRVPLADIDQWGLTGEIEIPLGADADLIYIGSYREYSASESYDSAFSGLDTFNVLPGGGTNIDTMTHELRIQGDAFGGALSWLVGGYYSTEDIAQDVNFGLGEDYDQLIGALLAGASAGGTITPGSPIFVGTNPLEFLTGVDPATVRTTNSYRQESTSWSIFTHNTLEVAEGLKLTVGLRYSDEDKDGSYSQPAVNNDLCPAMLGTLDPAALGMGQLVFGNLPAAFGPTALVVGCFPFVAPADLPLSAALPLTRTFDGNFSDSELIYTGKVSYEFAAPITTYASFTHGYKSGGFNLDSTAAIAGADPSFRSETVDAYEIGAKGKFLDNAVTVNLALFYEKFQDFQVLEFTGAQFQTFNVPKAQSKGFELETVIRPDDNFTLNAGLTYVDAEYPDDCAGDSTQLNVLTLCGNSLTNAPEFVAIMGANYGKDLGSNMKWFLNASIRAESDRRTSTQARFVPSAASVANDFGGDAQAAVDAAGLVPFDVQDGNVKINLRAGIGQIDDRWGIEAWATNITNVVTRGVTFNTTLRSGSRSAFVQEPRMYGVTLRGKF
ncbi:TonB-dependent receptor [Altererythrobacter sp. ZODW24]|uniref:TonB-dependent receptor n=1 Tax=Altererythrobacter sp. ZODW24 TaxID=2185142 RepID=UPI000DF74B12|nr:TonB-dependent receptor [Altererythrobacter sp. ZODW24]